MDPDPAFHFKADTDPAFHFNADPDPASHFNADPDLTFNLNADPDHAPHQADPNATASLQSLQAPILSLYRHHFERPQSSTAPFLSLESS